LNINGGFVDFAVGSASDDFGSGEVWVEVSDVHGAQTRHVLTVDVLPVNDAPTMTLAVPSVEWPWVTNLMGTPGEVTGLIGSYVAGPLNESGQQVSFEVEVLPLTLPAIVNDVVIDGAGHASFVYQGAAGAVDVRVRARDDGGTANAGSDASAWQVSRWQLGDLADLRVELVAVAGAGGAGSTRTYTVRVSNTGPDAVTHAPVQVSTVDGLTAVTWLCAGEGGGVCETAVGEAHVRVPVTLPVGGAVVLTIEGEIVAASVWAQLDVSAWAPAGVGVLSPADDSVSYVEPIAPEAVFRHGFE
jgi:hypothetical protein